MIPVPWTRADTIALVAVGVVAAAFRFWALDRTPPGLWRDEAGYGLAALDVLHGQFQVYWGDKEPLFPYLMAGVFAITGPSALALRATAAVIGTLTVLVTFLLGRVMLGRVGGVVAGLVLASVMWHVGFSRIGFRAITMPLIVTAAFLALWLAITRSNDKRPAAPWFGLAGLLIGLAPYTYLAGRVAPVVVALFLLGLLTLGRGVIRVERRCWLLLGSVAVVAFLPLGLFFLANPSYFTDRTTQLSPFTAARSVGEIASIVGRGLVDTAGMFFWHGDSEPRHNLPGRPALDPLTGAVFLVGLGLVLRRFREPGHLFLGLWLVLFLVPSALAIDNPHFLRTLGAAPAVALTVALGATGLAAAVRRFHLLSPRVLAALGVGWLLFAAGSTARDYFGLWANSPQVAAFFEADVVEEARLLTAARPDAIRFASAKFVPHPSTQLVTFPARDPIWFDGGNGLVTIPTTDSLLYGLTGSDEESLALLRRLFPTSEVRSGVIGPDGHPLAWSVRVSSATVPAWPNPDRSITARFGDVVGIGGVSTLPAVLLPGETTDLALWWSVLRSTDRPDIAFFAHLVDPTGATRAQADLQTYPSFQWSGGERVLSRFRLALPPGSLAGRYRVLIGAYPRSTLQRLPVFLAGQDGAFQPVGDLLEVGQVKVPIPPDYRLDGQPAVTSSALFDGRIGLEGWRVNSAESPDCDPAAARPPCSLQITLYWRSEARIGEPLTVFVHLADSTGRPVAQADSPPRAGTYPTDLWEAAERIPDPHDLRIAATVAPGRYRLLVGLYRPVTGARLMTATGDSVDLGEIVIGR